MPAVKIVIRTAILVVPTNSTSILIYNLRYYTKKNKIKHIIFETRHHFSEN